ncbi:MAG: tRNA (guanosine(46)-N7)-methyltransferase TrmB [Rickettsiales bacterium]
MNNQEQLYKNKPLRSFGRRKGRNLRASKQEQFAELLPQLELLLNDINLLDFNKETWLEIGFGGGEHLAYQARVHPEVNFIGCEPYINGISTLLTDIKENNTKNIRIYSDDARDLIKVLPDNSLGRVFILYPDPWPKKRHNKRRIISTELLDMLARVMKDGAELRLATDSSDYATWMLERLLAHPSFKWTAKSCDDWLNPPSEWISTRYERKALAGIPTYLNFERI